MFSKDRLKQLRLKNNILQEEIANYLGISRVSYTRWETGKYTPSKENLRQLAEFFNVDRTYFESEYEIIHTYLKLNKTNQVKLLDEANKLYFSQLIPYYVHARLSAGLGESYDENYEFDTVYFDKKYDYDIASYIKGNSMFPKYKDGDIALVKRTGYDIAGLVYAVVFEEELYIKKVYLDKDNVRLVSINKNYKDILAPLEEVRIIGVVTHSFTPIQEV